MMDMIIPADWRMSKDWVQFMIDLPMAKEPGTRFQYCNGAPFLLSAILQVQTGMNALSFAEKHLFKPLGISEVRWPSNPRGITLGYGCHWWIANSDAYIAAGNKGQFIMVAPDNNIVAVFTGRLSPNDFLIPLDLLAQCIIPAAKSPTALPENTIGKKALESKSALWQNTNPSDRKKSKQK